MEEEQAWNDDIRNLIFPPGYRFDPTDEELIVEYLIKKIKDEELPPNKIHQVDLYSVNPDTLAEVFEAYGDEEWYFFTSRSRKYRNGERPDRATRDGYWKASGADKPILVDGIVVGSKKALVHYVGPPPNGNKTNWIMHEYMDKTSTKRQRQHDQDMKLDDWVLCRIHRKLNRRRRQSPTGFPPRIPDNSYLPTPNPTSTLDSNLSSGFSTPSHAETPALPTMISDHNLPATNNSLSQSFPSHHFDFDVDEYLINYNGGLPDNL